MKIEDCKIGECVIANSGGPKMTIEKILEDMVYCFWFDGTKLKRSCFPISGVTLFGEVNVMTGNSLIVL